MVDAFLFVLEDVARRRTHADEIAAQAASRIRGETHTALLALEDERSNAYKEIEAVLREVRDANPPTRFLTTHAQVEKRFVIGVDPEEEPTEKSHLGDEIFADDELPQVLKGERPDVCAVFADEFGVWITGLAPIRDASGRIVAAVAADLPALSLSESETLRGDGRQTFASMLQTAAVRLSRAEIDAITDALTGLYNHRYLHERLSEEIHRARELQRPLSVLFCDLDHFKGYNDSNGHSAGDAVLREVAHVIEQSVRNIDIAARYGGEEFVVLLVETERETALGVAERIRERIRAAGFTANNVPLTVSIGVAGYPEDADRREDLLNKADWAMYLAKRRGRDQVASFGEGVSRGGGRRRSRPGPGASGPAAAGDADVAAPQGQALPVEVLEEGLRVAASTPGGVAEPGQRHLARALAAGPAAPPVRCPPPRSRTRGPCPRGRPRLGARARRGSGRARASAGAAPPPVWPASAGRRAPRGGAP